MSAKLITNLAAIVFLSILGFWLGFITQLSHLKTDKKASDLPLMLQIEDVGDGDAAYVKAPHGISELIDTGPDEASAAHIITGIQRLSRNAPSVIILTNTGMPSIGGLAYILQHTNFIGPIVLPCSEDEFKHQAGLQGQEAIQEAETKGLPLIPFTDISNNPAVMKLLNSIDKQVSCQTTLIPIFQSNGVRADEFALRVDVNEGSLLYIAGLSSFDQDQLISQRVNLNCDVLASSSSNDESSLSNEFLAESQPSVVTLSNSQESPPSDEVLGRLKAADVTIARTDISGAINIGISSDPSIAPKFYSSNSIIPLN